MDVTVALLDSWDRNCEIIDAVATRIDEGNRHAKPSEDGWTLDHQLAHMHNVRRYFLSQISQAHAAGLGASYGDEEGVPIDDLEEIKRQLQLSGKAIRAAVADGIEKGCGPMAGGTIAYDNPVVLLQHMLWHDGWHTALIFLALRLNGQEPGDEWEEPNVWGRWRTESW